MQHYRYEDFVEAVAARLKELRLRKGSIRKFAADYGWDHVHWSRIEKGQTMSLDTLIKAANSFDLSIVELIDTAAEKCRLQGPGEGSQGFTGPKRRWSRVEKAVTKKNEAT